MDARVAVLEEIAAATKDAVVDLRQEVRDSRTEQNSFRAEIRNEQSGFRTDVNRRIDALHASQERDFRILFSALITTALGLAAMMAKGFHWF